MRLWTSSLGTCLAALALAAGPVQGASLLDYVGECVPFARAASGIQIYGDAWTWWDQADGRYRRGYQPRIGAVIVFARSARLPLGHVAVISRVVTSRVVMVTHANWSRIAGERGHAEQDVTLTDVSPDGDWSAVRVWYQGAEGLGSTTYPVYGFIYGIAVGRTEARAKTAPELTGHDPDYVGALIDAYVR
jgi:surface antigen